MAELVLKGISKIFPGGVQAVADFNIEIEHGEFVVLVGPSGCGKSTVLRMIAGLEKITSGDLYMDGKRINDVAPSNRDISMVFQNYALYGHMSVYENMAFSQIIRHENPYRTHQKVMGAAEVVELQRELNRFPKNLSGGQRQRVALGRSIVSHAQIILMDEPLSNLDAKLRGQSRRELIKLHQRLGNTFIYVTHDQTEALTMAGRIVVMDQGKVQQIGSPDEVYNWPENLFVAGFIGSPPMNFFIGQLSADGFQSPAFTCNLPPEFFDQSDSALQDKVIFGIRPEHFSQVDSGSSPFIEGEIIDREYLGDRSLLYIQTGDQVVAASLKTKQPMKIGAGLRVYVDLKAGHLFDPVSGIRIRNKRGQP